MLRVRNKFESRSKGLNLRSTGLDVESTHKLESRHKMESKQITYFENVFSNMGSRRDGTSLCLCSRATPSPRLTSSQSCCSDVVFPACLESNEIKFLNM